MRKALAVLAILFCSTTPALGQVSFSFDTPGVSIGFNVPAYPQLVRIPGYPVYYAPQLDENYFFYDGLYWVFNDGNWYASAWYNGPWDLVSPDAVPLFILRVPVRYYRAPPVFFRGWARNAPPRWGMRWGARWEDQHRGWDRWNRASAPAPAPLPTYQRQFAGNRYPSRVEQRTLESRNYHYQPRDRFAQQHVQRGPVQNAQTPRTPQQRNATTTEATRNAERAQNQGRQAQRAVPPATAQRATPPTAERRGTPPAMANRGAPVAPQQRAGTPRPEQRAATPRPEQRAATPRPEQRAATPRPEQRAAERRPEQRAATPRPEQRAAAARPELRGPAMARGPAQSKQAQARAPQGHAQGRGQAQANEHGGGNARAGEHKDEHNG